MWPVTGTRIEPERFRPFQPLQVLYGFDGPRTFTHQDQEGNHYLAHWCDEDDQAVRFVVVPTTALLVEHLQLGKLSVREALDQPHCWLLEVFHDGAIRDGWQVRLEDLPTDVLPEPGALLLPALESPNGQVPSGEDRTKPGR